MDGNNKDTLSATDFRNEKVLQNQPMRSDRRGYRPSHEVTSLSSPAAGCAGMRLWGPLRRFPAGLRLCFLFEQGSLWGRARAWTRVDMNFLG